MKEILDQIQKRLDKVAAIPTSEDEGIEFPDGEESYSDGVLQGRFEELMWCKKLISQYIESVNRREGSKGNGYGETIS